MARIDTLYFEAGRCGSLRMVDDLANESIAINRDCVRHRMRFMG